MYCRFTVTRDPILCLDFVTEKDGVVQLKAIQILELLPRDNYLNRKISPALLKLDLGLDLKEKIVRIKTFIGQFIFILFNELVKASQ